MARTASLALAPGRGQVADQHAVGGDHDGAGVEPAVADAGHAQGGGRGPHLVDELVGDGRRVDLGERGRVGLVGHEHGVAGLDGPGHDDPRHPHPGRGGGVQHQALVLDLFASSERRRRACVAVPERAPGPGEQLRVAGVPAVHGDAERRPGHVDAVVAGDAPLLAVGPPEVGGAHAELGEVGGHAPLGREPGRRPRHQPHRHRHRDAEGVATRRRERGYALPTTRAPIAREEDHRAADVAHRAGHVGAGDHHHGRHEPDPQRRVRRCVLGPQQAAERRPRAVGRLGDGPADGDRQRGGEHEVAGERPTPGGDRPDHQHEDQHARGGVRGGPQRLEPRQQPFDRSGRLGGAPGLAATGERGDDHHARGDAEEHRIVDAPSPRFVPGGREQRVRHRHGHERRRSRAGLYGAAVWAALTRSG